MVPVELLWRGMSLVVMLAALVPFRPSTVVHVIETPHLARFLVGRQAFLLLDSEASACKHAPSLGISYTGSRIGHPGPSIALIGALSWSSLALAPLTDLRPPDQVHIPIL